jgi:hypothetical protein
MRAVDPRQQPAGWSSNLLMLGATAPGQQVEHRTGTEVFQLDETLLQKAYALSAGVALEDSDAAAAYRLQYPQPAARAAPAVSICDSLTSDTYWHGSLIATAMEAYVQLTTDGRGRYCITQMEDNATLTALKRGAEAGLQFRPRGARTGRGRLAVGQVRWLPAIDPQRLPSRACVDRGHPDALGGVVARRAEGVTPCLPTSHPPVPCAPCR